MNSKTKKQPIFNSEKELADFLLGNLADSLKQAVKATAKTMIKQEMEDLREEIDKKLSFNGYYQRHMYSGLGKIENINIPRFRETPNNELNIQSLNIFDQEKEKFFKLASEMHRLGISQRKIKQLCRACFGIDISKGRVGLVHRELAKQESLQINSQPLTDEFEYLLVDGLRVKCKHYGLRDSNKMNLLCALGITQEGKRKIIGFIAAEKENYESWYNFLKDLKQRGLLGKKLRLIIADDNGGLTKVAGQLYPKVKLQVCMVHKMRNVMGKASYKNKKAVIEDIKRIYNSNNIKEANNHYQAFAKKWYIAEEAAVRSLRYDFDRTLTYMEFPKEIWKKIRTTNILEREFREARRRIKVFDNSFNNIQSLENYSNAIFDYLNNHYPARSIHTKG